MTPFMTKYLALIITTFLTFSAHSETVNGQATVIDGDTLEIREQRIRLHGVDAFESNQLCTSRHGQKYRCGAKAANALDRFIGSRNVSCKKKGMSYNRWVATCHVGETDLAQWMVAKGWALAWTKYSRRYLPDMNQAERLMLGAWSGTFAKPWVFRKNNRQ